jgi:hypothetical protein
MTATATSRDDAAVGNARHTWVPYAAITAGAMLLIKAVLIIGSEDSIADAPMVTLYFGGIAVALAAAIGAGLRARRGRRTLVAVGLSVALVLFIITGLGGPVFAAMSDAAWVEDEGPIGLLGLILIALGATRTTTRS